MSLFQIETFNGFHRSVSTSCILGLYFKHRFYSRQYSAPSRDRRLASGDTQICFPFPSRSYCLTYCFTVVSFGRPSDLDNRNNQNKFRFAFSHSFVREFDGHHHRPEQEREGQTRAKIFGVANFIWIVKILKI